MAICAKLLEQARASPANLRFDDLCRLMKCQGYVFVRQKGSHSMYRTPLDRSPHPVQPDKNGHAKTYQVRQVLAVIETLADEADKEEGAS